MKKDVADRWVAELRSGKYRQGAHHLRKNNNYCCLGVLCEVLGIESSQLPNGEYVYGRYSNVLDSNILDKAGMRSCRGQFGPDNLAAMNDRGAPFAQIADMIEKNWEKL